MLSSKELMQLEDYLTKEQSSVQAMNFLAGSIQDSQAKQMLQQIAQKKQQHFQTVSRHLGAGQNMQ